MSLTDVSLVSFFDASSLEPLPSSYLAASNKAFGVEARIDGKSTKRCFWPWPMNSCAWKHSSFKPRAYNVRSLQPLMTKHLKLSTHCLNPCFSGIKGTSGEVAASKLARRCAVGCMTRPETQRSWAEVCLPGYGHGLLRRCGSGRVDCTGCASCAKTGACGLMGRLHLQGTGVTSLGAPF